MERVPVTSPLYRRGVRPPNAGKRYPPETYTPAEIRRMLEATSGGATGVRNRALIWTLWRAGLRISEALALYPRDVDLDAGTIRVAVGKGGKFRMVGIDASARPAIELWLDRRRKLGLTGRHPLFCRVRQPDRGRALRSALIREFFTELGERAGVEKRVHPHGFRHTLASELAFEGVALPTIQAQLGHSSIVTTARYIAKIAPAALVKTIQARTPPAEIALNGNRDVAAQLAAIEAALAEIKTHAAPASASPAGAAAAA